MENIVSAEIVRLEKDREPVDVTVKREASVEEKLSWMLKVKSEREADPVPTVMNS